MKSIPMAALLISAAALAQQPPARDVSALKTYLSLTDAQVTALQAIRTQQRTATGDIQQQIRQKQQALNHVLAALETAPGYRPAQQLLLELEDADKGR